MDTVQGLNVESAAGAARPERVAHAREPEPDGRHSFAEEAKDIQKQKLRRRVLEDPAFARKLIAAESTAVYNAKGEIIQAVTAKSVAV